MSWEKRCPRGGRRGRSGTEFGCTAKHIFTHIEWRMTARILETERDMLPEGWVWADWDELRQRYAIPNAFDGVGHLVEQRLKRME